MYMTKVSISSLLVLISLSISGAADSSSISVKWKMSTENALWRDMPDAISTVSDSADILVDADSLKQTYDGFGGEFNEKGWTALSLLPQEKQNEVLKALFDRESGAKFTMGRIPIGASNYAESRYTLNEKKNDYKMKYFSIARDKEKLIPFIKASLKFNPELKLWASAWTPPTWMKTNGGFDSGYIKDDPKIYDAYALYLKKFIESYKTEGMDIFAVAVQNEPTILYTYPTCGWEANQFLVFIRDHLGPLFEKSNLSGRIMLGTLSEGYFNDYSQKILRDSKANKYVGYVGFQWNALPCVSTTREAYPDKNLIQTQAECGNWYWKAGFDPNKPQNDWAYGAYSFNLIKTYFNNGVNSYMLWNMVLDDEGKDNDSKRPWPQNAAIVVDRATKEPVYTPMYYAVKHFSYYVKPGAKYTSMKNGSNYAIAFTNPDGEVVVMVQTDMLNPAEKTIGVNGRVIKVNLPAKSWSTFIFPKK
jgi:glucosylceramidase